jgi:hypothetical protein
MPRLRHRTAARCAGRARRPTSPADPALNRSAYPGRTKASEAPGDLCCALSPLRRGAPGPGVQRVASARYSRERAKTNKAISQPLAPQSTPAPGPSVSRPESSARAPEELFHPATTAPRAVLVKLPPPRAELVRIPEWRIGETRSVMMPYGLVASATYRGRLGAETELPQSGNALGDMWAVGNNVWLWLVEPGAAAASWIDP